MFKRTLAFDPEHDEQIFAEIPARRGVFLLQGHDPASEPYISKAGDLRRRIKRLLAPGESHTKRLNLRDKCASIRFTETGSDFENVLLLYRSLRAAFPDTCQQRLRLALSPLIRFHWENPYPRAYVTRKLGKSGAKHSTYYGPFRSRAVADRYLNDVLDLFKSRRCTFELDPDPAFPGCVYSEMKMCLAPCFKGCTDDEYKSEVRRVEDFIGSRGESLLAELARQREEASLALEFEKAAAIHAKVEKIKTVVQQADEIVRNVHEFDAVIVQPSLEGETVSLFRFSRGVILGPIEFSVLGMALANPESGQSSLHIQPMMFEPVPLEEDAGGNAPPKSEPGSKPEARLRAAIDQLAAGEPAGVTAHAEHLALLKRWYYRGSRMGEIFCCDDGQWPWRRMLNGISRVFVGQKKLKDGESRLSEQTS